MKHLRIRQTRSLIILALSLTLANAQAFYNPSVGRWLNRESGAPEYDPETYGMLGNDAQSWTEALGSAPNLEFSITELGLKDLENQHGSTKCDPNKPPNAPMDVSNENETCTGRCTGEHENQHVQDRSACCKKYRQAYQRKGANQVEVARKYREYIESSRNWAECRAYKQSKACAEEILTAHHCDCIDEQCCRDTNAYLKAAEAGIDTHCLSSDHPEWGDPHTTPTCPFG